MTTQAPPTIFSRQRRMLVRQRALRAQAVADAARYLMDDMVDDVQERLAFLRHQPKSALVVGDYTGQLAASLQAQGCAVECLEPALNGDFDEETPYPARGFELIASLGTLDTVNDLPGALIHLRNALAPGGLLVASFFGAGSLSRLRSIMLEADGDRPAARMHPLVDVRAGGQLLQRTGWKSPVIDSRPITVRFSSLESLLADVRSQGASCALSSARPALGKAGLERARAAFAARADTEGRLTETFEILTLSGWRP